MTTPISSINRPDVIVVGAGIMSATLAVILKELDPSLKLEIYEVLGSEAQESSNAWNNVGAGHAALRQFWSRARVTLAAGVRIDGAQQDRTDT
jgi:malate dehydrogenase (quinone)